MDSGEHEQQAKRLRLETNHADGAPHTNGAAAAAAAAALQRASALLQLPPPGHRLALPEGWLDCPPVGQRLFCNHLLPCKVPLGRQFDAVLAGPLEASRFTPAEARRAVQSLSSVSAPPGSPFRPYAVAIIDLTKTERYYTPEQEGLSTARTPLQGPGVVKHVKIPCAGSDGPPTPSEVNQFIYWVDVLLDEALRSRRKAGDWPVILVHCTHGFNRTGAMLVHYAMRCKGARPDLVNAVARFADARTPGIYKEGYISALFEYYHDVRPMPPHAACPPLPAWKREKQLGGSVAAPPVPDAQVPPGDLWGLDNESYMAASAVSHIPLPDEEGAAAAAARAAAAELNGVPGVEGPPEMRHDDTLGEEVPLELEMSVRSIMQQLVARERGDPAATVFLSSGEFPGAQPVSLMRTDAPQLLEPAMDYRVSWKADGTRYMMLLLHGGAYLLDRAGRVRRVQMRFPGPEFEAGKAHRPMRTLDYTLLDGEMVVDVPQAGGSAGPSPMPVRRFLAYDLCAFRTVSPDPHTGQLTQLLCGRPWRERVKLLAELVIRPKRAYEEACGAGRYRAEREPFRVRVKDFYDLSRTEWVLRKWMPTLTHPSDGLVFQSGVAAYVPHTDERLFKWKFPHMNTVDFMVLQDTTGAPVLCVTDSSGGMKDIAAVPMPQDVATDARGVSPTTAGFHTDDAEPGEQLYVGLVAEFRWDAHRGGWSFLRVRRDKNHPNHESVFVKVWRSIRDGITQEDLLNMLGLTRTDNGGGGHE